MKRTKNNMMKGCLKSTMADKKLTNPRIREIKKGDYTKVEEIYSSKRSQFSKSVMDFKFEKSRVRILNGCNEMREGKSVVMYWMFRDQRVQDNWAMLFAQRLALKYKVPLMVCCLIPKLYMNYNLRHYDFMIGGLECVHRELKSLNIPCHTIVTADVVAQVEEMIHKYNISTLVTDFLPLSPFKIWVDKLVSSIPNNVSFCQVDAHNVIPCWVTSDKREYAARTIRLKIDKLRSDYLTDFPPVILHEFNKKLKFPDFDPVACMNDINPDASVTPITWCKPGYKQGLVQLEKFVQEGLMEFASSRNDAVVEKTSKLSPWLHFGHLSAQRAILRAIDYIKECKKDVEVFVEETLVRRELSDNYCYYTEVPDSPESAPNWAKIILAKHMKDPRPYLYDLPTLEGCKTHDDIWNSAQNQLVTTGKMFGYLRMYWCKKFLEWCATPETALKYSLYLNDKYSIDGNDPNGIVGCMWSIYGLHDRPWGERDVFGYIRYMSDVGCRRHFDVNSYIEKYKP